MVGLISPLAQSSGNGSAVGVLVPILLMVGVFYFLLIRPQQRRAKQQRTLLQAIDVGDDVVTIGGIFGRVTEVGEDDVTVEISERVEVRFKKSAIAGKLTFDESSVEGHEEAGDQS